jgi:hypothetical protein
MPLDLVDYENKAKEAVKAFWGNRAAAVAKQKELGREDQGERAGVTAGKNMDGFRPFEERQLMIRAAKCHIATLARIHGSFYSLSRDKPYRFARRSWTNPVMGWAIYPHVFEGLLEKRYFILEVWHGPA